MSGGGSNGFRPRKHVNAVLAASSAAHGARLVLLTLCHHMEFGKPEVTITRPQIEEFTGLSRDTILRAYKLLKAEGTITAIRNADGGRGIATTYRLAPAGQGAASAPQAAGEGDVWDRVRDRIERYDPAAVQSWLGSMEFDGISGGTMTLVAPTPFAAQHCRTHLTDQVTAAAQKIAPEVERVQFVAA